MTAIDKAVHQGRPAKMSILGWKSSHLKRAVESTLGAEVQAFVRGAKEVEWYVSIWADAFRQISLERREEGLQKFPSLIVTDCKPLYDALLAPNQGNISDRSTAWDELIGKEILKRASIQARWVPTTLQLADAFTKEGAVVSDMLREAMRNLSYMIGDEQAVMARRAAERKKRIEQGQLRAAQNNQPKKCESGA